MVGGWEDLYALASDRLIVVKVCDQNDLLLLIPVRHAATGVVPGRDRGESGDGHAQNIAIGPAIYGEERSVLGRELDLVVLRLVGAANDSDLEPSERSASNTHFDALALKESIGQPACRNDWIGLVTHQPAAGNSHGASLRGRVLFNSDLTHEVADARQAADGNVIDAG